MELILTVKPLVEYTVLLSPFLFLPPHIPGLGVTFTAVNNYTPVCWSPTENWLPYFLYFVSFNPFITLWDEYSSPYFKMWEMEVQDHAVSGKRESQNARASVQSWCSFHSATDVSSASRYPSIDIFRLLGQALWFPSLWVFTEYLLGTKHRILC